MGLGGISIWQLLIILVIVLLIFGTKRLKNLGGDLGGAIKGFKEAVGSDENEKKDSEDEPDGAQTRTSTEQTSQGSADPNLDNKKT